MAYNYSSYKLSLYNMYAIIPLTDELKANLNGTGILLMFNSSLDL